MKKANEAEEPSTIPETQTSPLDVSVKSEGKESCVDELQTPPRKTPYNVVPDDYINMTTAQKKQYRLKKYAFFQKEVSRITGELTSLPATYGETQTPLKYTEAHVRPFQVARRFIPKLQPLQESDESEESFTESETESKGNSQELLNLQKYNLKLYLNISSMYLTGTIQ